MLPDEFPPDVLSNHTVVAYKTGNNYLLFYGKTYTKETTILYGANILEKGNDTKASYRFSVGVFTSESRAHSFFKGNTLASPLLKDDVSILDNSIYNSDEISCIEKADYLFLVIRKHRFVTLLTLDNLEVHEKDLRPILQEKMKNLNDLVRMNRI